MDAKGAASALLWWREAGVDTVVGEAPRDWLAAPPRPRPAAAPEAPAAGDEVLPATLASFQAWLTSAEALPLGAPAAPRVGPSGDPAAGLMVLVDMPTAEDVAAGRLLSGEPGRLFDRMMAAIGRSRETLYLASLSPVRFPTGRIDPAFADRLAVAARHHAALAAPRALLLFGDACARALAGAPLARARGRWHEIATPAGPVRTLVTLSPDFLLRQPGQKNAAWTDLKMLTEGLQP